MILFILSLHDASQLVSAQEKYGLEEVVWKVPRRQFSAWPYFVSEWNERSISVSLFGLTHPIKFLLMRRSGLEVDVVWRISRSLFSSRPYWYLNKMILFILSLHVAWFLLKRTYGFEEEIVWRIQRGLFNAWPSLICEWNDLINSGSQFCLSFCARGYMVCKVLVE